MKPHGPALHCMPVLLTWAVACAGVFHPIAVARAEIGAAVADSELRVAGGGKARLLADAAATALVFFRPDQPRSQRALPQLERCRRQFAGKAVRWVALVPGSADIEGAMAIVRREGVSMPVLVDDGDALYGSLGLALHPAVVVIGADRKVAAYEPYRSINYCAAVAARLQRMLGEISELEMQRALDPRAAARGTDAEVARRFLALAQTLYQAGHYERAVANVLSSLDRDPAAPAAHILLANILASQNRCAEARVSYARARELAPSGEAAGPAATRCGE